MGRDNMDGFYVPSQKDGPKGPRDDEGQLNDIENNTARFEEGGNEEVIDDIIDPFSPQVAPQLQLIVQMRIYDALMALLSSTDKEVADALHALHSEGKILYSLPFIDLDD